MENAIVTALACDEKCTPPTVDSEKMERMAAFFATDVGSTVLYEAVKNYMSTPEGITVVENAIVAAFARREWRDNYRISQSNRRRRTK